MTLLFDDRNNGLFAWELSSASVDYSYRDGVSLCICPVGGTELHIRNVSHPLYDTVRNSQSEIIRYVVSELATSKYVKIQGDFC